MTPVEQVRALGGAARFNDLASSRYQLRQALDRGELIQPARGCYALPQATQEAVLAARTNSVLSCVTALREHDPSVPCRPTSIHVSAPPRRGHRDRFPRILHVHEEVVEQVDGRRLATIECAAIRMALCQPYDSVVVMLDHLTRANGLAFLARVIDGVAARRSSRAHALQVDVDPRARSPIETRVRLALRRAGFRVVPGALVPSVGEVDFVVEGILVVELDGFEYHSSREPYRDDRRRDRRCTQLDLPSMRFAYEDSDPERVQREITPVLQRERGRVPKPTERITPTVRRALALAQAAWLAPENAATGWRHLTGTDASQVRRTFPESVPW